MSDRNANAILVCSACLGLLSVGVLIWVFTHRPKTPPRTNPTEVFSTPVPSPATPPAKPLATGSSWPTAAMVFAGFPSPEVQADGSQLLVLHGKKLGIRYMADEIDILQANNFDDVSESERIELMLRCSRDFMRLVNNIIPAWDGAGSSACSVLAAVRAEDRLLCLWHDGFRLHFSLTDTHRAVVISRSPRASN